MDSLKTHEKYTKNSIIKNANEIVIWNEKLKTINPTKEQILADGWIKIK